MSACLGMSPTTVPASTLLELHRYLQVQYATLQLTCSPGAGSPSGGRSSGKLLKKTLALPPAERRLDVRVASPHRGRLESDNTVSRLLPDATADHPTVWGLSDLLPTGPPFESVSAAPARFPADLAVQGYRPTPWQPARWTTAPRPVCRPPTLHRDLHRHANAARCPHTYRREATPAMLPEAVWAPKTAPPRPRGHPGPALPPAGSHQRRQTTLLAGAKGEV